MTPKVARARASISALLNEIHAHFTSDVKLTLVARFDGRPESDFVLTSEQDLDQVVAALERAKARPDA